MLVVASHMTVINEFIDLAFTASTKYMNIINLYHRKVSILTNGTKKHSFVTTTIFCNVVDVCHSLHKHYLHGDVHV